MEEKKFLGMPKNVCLGLGWLLFPFAIVALAMEHEKMNREDKKQFVSIFVAMGVFLCLITITTIVQTILSVADVHINWVFTLINLLAWVGLSLLPMIFAFLNENFHCPIAFDLADKFVKGEDGETVEAEVVEEEPKEEQKEEKEE